MRIAVTASLVTPLRPAQTGGAQSFLCDLAAALEGRGHEVDIWCAEGSAVPGSSLRTVAIDAAAAEAALVKPGTTAARSGAPLPALRDGFERLFAGVRAGGYDAVSQHAFDAEAIEMTEGMPVVHTLHLPPVVPPVVAVCRRSSGLFITVSDAQRRAWTAAGLRGVSVIRNGVPSFGVAACPVERVALVAGRVSPEKGTAAALRVAARLGLEPRLAGSVYDPDYWEREVRLPVTPMPRAELWALMARAALTLMPVEWEEPYGMVAAESQLAGCPVAGYRRGGLPEVVLEGVGGFLAEPGDFEGLVRAGRRAVRLNRGAVRSSALGRLLIGPVAEAYERALERVAEQGPRRDQLALDLRRSLR